jgi:flagellin
MALTILNNIPSLMAENELNITNASLQNTLFQLASGSRINSGADDPAGLAIANGLQANINALEQSTNNANNAVGNLQVADGALGQVTNLLDTAVTLATEASNSGLTSNQSLALDNEFTAIKNEINQIGATTTFNGSQVFNGSAVAAFMSDGTAAGTPETPISATPGTLSATALGLGGAATGTLTAISNFTAGNTITIGPTGNQTTYTFVASLPATPAAGDVLIGSGGATSAANIAESLANLAAAINGTSDTNAAGTQIYDPYSPAANSQVTASSVTGTTLTLTAIEGGVAGNNILVTSSNPAVATWNGAGGSSSLSGGSAGTNLQSTTSAQSALTQITSAIATIALTRGNLGAGINQLQAAVNVANVQVQNVTSSENTITAADIPTLVANLNKYDILEQTGISALAQANNTQQAVLKLLQ